jgi:hypothetical protein
MNKFRIVMTSLVLMLSLVGAPLLASTPTLAACAAGSKPKDCISAGSNTTTAAGTPKLTDNIKTITNILLFLIGVISVIAIVIGGIRYTTSGGDSSAVNSAKDTILYAVVGIVVAILAYSIVNFVVANFS